MGISDQHVRERKGVWGELRQGRERERVERGIDVVGGGRGGRDNKGE